MGRDAITGLVVLAASLALFWMTLGLERHPMVPVGPGFYPRIILGTAAALAILLIVVALLARRRAAGSAREAPVGYNYGLVALAFAVFGLYVLALPALGFRAATFVFVAALQAVLEPPRGARRWAGVLVLAAATTIATYYVFEHYLHVLLPRGRWTGF